MTINKKIGAWGIVIVLAYFAYSAYIGVKISSGFGMDETLGELQISAVNSAVLAFPALVLFFVNKFKKNIEWLGFAYLGTLVLGLIYLFVISTDALAWGMIMMWVELLAVIIWIVLLVLKEK